jgi:hypothetical protein
MRFIGSELEREKRLISAGLIGRLTDVKVCVSLSNSAGVTKRP